MQKIENKMRNETQKEETKKEKRKKENNWIQVKER